MEYNDFIKLLTALKPAIEAWTDFYDEENAYKRDAKDFPIREKLYNSKDALEKDWQELQEQRIKLQQKKLHLPQNLHAAFEQACTIATASARKRNQPIDQLISDYDILWNLKNPSEYDLSLAKNCLASLWKLTHGWHRNGSNN